MFDIIAGMDDEAIVQHLEAILFVGAQPVAADKLVQLLNLQSVVEIDTFVKLLNERYTATKSALQVIKAAGAYRLCVRAELNHLVKDLTVHREVRLSAASMETLAVIAYRQPITKAEVEDIRGVKIDKTLQTLLDFKLIKEAGRKQVLGRPILYATTEEFLRKFCLDSLRDLPTIPEDAFDKHIV